jgi:hypothetical protein
MNEPTLRRLALACHAALTLAIAVGLSSPPVTPLGTGMAVLLVAPLLAMLFALVTRRRGAERWLTVLLVPYAGALSVEVVARAGGSPLLSASLLVCVFEIGLLLTLIRARGGPRDARG